MADIPVVHLPGRDYADEAVRRDWRKRGFAVTAEFSDHPVRQPCALCTAEREEPAMADEQAGPASLGEIAAVIERGRLIERRVRALADEWTRASDADEAPSTGYDAYARAAAQVYGVLSAAGPAAPEDHLAEIERHVRALYAERELPKRCRHAWPSGPVERQETGTAETCLLGCRTIRRRGLEGVRFVYPEGNHG